MLDLANTDRETSGFPHSGGRFLQVILLLQLKDESDLLTLEARSNESVLQRRTARGWETMVPPPAHTVVELAALLRSMASLPDRPAPRRLAWLRLSRTKRRERGWGIQCGRILFRLRSTVIELAVQFRSGRTGERILLAVRPFGPAAAAAKLVLEELFGGPAERAKPLRDIADLDMLLSGTTLAKLVWVLLLRAIASDAKQLVFDLGRHRSSVCSSGAGGSQELASLPGQLAEEIRAAMWGLVGLFEIDETGPRRLSRVFAWLKKREDSDWNLRMKTLEFWVGETAMHVPVTVTRVAGGEQIVVDLRPDARARTVAEQAVRTLGERGVTIRALLDRAASESDG